MQNARITLHPSQQRMQVRVDGILSAESPIQLNSANMATRHFTRENVQLADIYPERPSAEIEYAQESLACNARFSGGSYNTSTLFLRKYAVSFFKAKVYEKALYAYVSF